MAIYTRFGHEVEIIAYLGEDTGKNAFNQTVNGVWVVLRSVQTPYRRREVYLGDINADGGIAEIDAAIAAITASEPGTGSEYDVERIYSESWGFPINAEEWVDYVTPYWRCDCQGAREAFQHSTPLHSMIPVGELCPHCHCTEDGYCAEDFKDDPMEDYFWGAQDLDSDPYERDTDVRSGYYRCFFGNVHRVEDDCVCDQVLPAEVIERIHRDADTANRAYFEALEQHEADLAERAWQRKIDAEEKAENARLDELEEAQERAEFEQEHGYAPARVAYTHNGQAIAIGSRVRIRGKAIFTYSQSGVLVLRSLREKATPGTVLNIGNQGEAVKVGFDVRPADTWIYWVGVDKLELVEQFANAENTTGPREDIEFLRLLVELDAILRTSGWKYRNESRNAAIRAVEILEYNGYDTLVKALLRGYGYSENIVEAMDS